MQKLSCFRNSNKIPVEVASTSFSVARIHTYGKYFYGSQWVCSFVFVVIFFFFVFFRFENRNVFQIYQDQEREALKTFNVITDAKNEKRSRMGLIKFAAGCTTLSKHIKKVRIPCRCHILDNSGRTCHCYCIPPCNL